MSALIFMRVVAFGIVSERVFQDTSFNIAPSTLDFDLDVMTSLVLVSGPLKGDDFALRRLRKESLLLFSLFMDSLLLESFLMELRFLRLGRELAPSFESSPLDANSRSRLKGGLLFEEASKNGGEDSSKDL